MTLEVTVYTRAGCGLCEEALEALHALSRTHSLRIVEVDIVSDPALEKALFDRIPVIEIGGTRLEAPIEVETLRRALESQSQTDDLQHTDRTPRTRTPSGRSRLGRHRLPLPVKRS